MYNVLDGLLLRDVFPDLDVLFRFLKCNQKVAVDWFLEFVMVSLVGIEFHQKVEEGAETRDEMICWKPGRLYTANSPTWKSAHEKDCQVN